MIKIRVKFFGPFRDLFGGRERDIDFPGDGRLRLLLERLCDTPERERQAFARASGLSPHAVVMKNGQPVQSPDGLEIPLHDGDVIAIFPFLGGG
ncbi:MAG TPA: MoaD/ThiS family protein [Candidatus Desulfaltia sp.]|nr:MoaD/ThiS family protein [Candidatus Desulfaltia sp.]